MRLRTFTVPFAKVAEFAGATELEFGPDDVLVVRPLFTMSRQDAAAYAERIKAVEEQALAAADKAIDDPLRVAAEEAAGLLILDTLRKTIDSWTLVGPQGDIAMPETVDQLDALPAGLANALFPFLRQYRGDDPNPSTPR